MKTTVAAASLTPLIIKADNADELRGFRAHLQKNKPAISAKVDDGLLRDVVNGHRQDSPGTPDEGLYSVVTRDAAEWIRSGR